MSKSKTANTIVRTQAVSSKSLACRTKAPHAKTTSAKKTAAARAPKSFTTSPRVTAATSKDQSPFSSFITTGLRMRNRYANQPSDIAYDLSNDELRFMGSYNSPMKAVPAGERELLKSGQRGAYLALRYEHTPDRKYNFPEATSWRIGWLHNQRTNQHSGL